MTTDTVGSSQESINAMLLDSGDPGLVLYQNSVVGPTFIKTDTCLPLLSSPARITETVCRSAVEGAFPSDVSDLVICVLLAVFTVVLVLALVVVPDNGLMLDDPISFARGE